MRAIRSFGVLRSFAIASALIGAGFTASAQTPKPDLLTPMASHTDWLFNVGTNGTREKFEWKTVTGASSYEFVISQSSTFANYTASTALCKDTGCKTITKTTTSVDHKEMAGFWFLPKQYYWRVRAKKNSVWSDWSTARSFAPYLYMDIAVKAYGNSNGIAFDSPLSRLKGTPSKPNVTATWLTELDAVGANGYNADGALLLAAHATYKAATNKDLGSAAVPTALRTTMRSNLTRTGGWALRERDFLIDQIKATYNATAALNRDNVLERLRIRAQCKEYADRMVIDGGGTPKAYSAMVSVGVGVKPGHYVTRSGHAAIANAVRFTTAGVAEARVSEANAYGLGGDGTWSSNPGGQTPWMRNVRHSAVYEITTSSYMKAYRAH